MVTMREMAAVMRVAGNLEGKGKGYSNEGGG
jgi:hypothetical protein